MAKRTRAASRIFRHKRVRKAVIGTSDRPRLSVFRSLNHIYAQIIDDGIGHTISASSTIDSKIRSKSKKLNKTELASLVGKQIAEQSKKLGIKRVVFDRGGHKYHGRVKAVAEAVREAGLEF